MQTIYHPAIERGHANFGWLDTNHSFSFGNFYNPEKMGFGALRVLNDDFVIGGKGFDKHPHDNMEIISIPLEGELEHEDSMGNKFVIRENDVQIMSAGNGVFHSEYNKNSDRSVNFLQIWIFPKEKNIEPRYDQKNFDPADRLNKWQELVSPENGDGIMINQNSWLSRTRISSNTEIKYKFSGNNTGTYFFIIDGKAEIAGKSLAKRDAIGVWDTNELDINVLSDADILAIEVPI